jgi:hypothetical protein
MDELLDTVTDLTAMDGLTDYGHSVDKVTRSPLTSAANTATYAPAQKGLEWTSTPTAPHPPRTRATPPTRGGCTLMAVWAATAAPSPTAPPRFTLPSTLTVKVLGSKTLRNSRTLTSGRTSEKAGGQMRRAAYIAAACLLLSWLLRNPDTRNHRSGAAPTQTATPTQPRCLRRNRFPTPDPWTAEDVEAIARVLSGECYEDKPHDKRLVPRLF